MTKPSDWKNEPMPDENDIFHSGRKLSHSKYSKLKAGIKATNMDDKWFVYSMYNSIYFHRSWTGHCIYIVNVKKDNGNIFLENVVVNRNSAQFGTRDIELNKDMSKKLVDLVLRRN